MSRISDVPEDMLESNRRCIICGDAVPRGGFWAGEREIYVCLGCPEKLIHLALDTQFDSPYADNEIRTARSLESLNYFKQKHTEWLLRSSRVFWSKAFAWLAKKQTDDTHFSDGQSQKGEEGDDG